MILVTRLIFVSISEAQSMGFERKTVRSFHISEIIAIFATAPKGDFPNQVISKAIYFASLIKK